MGKSSKDNLLVQRTLPMEKLVSNIGVSMIYAHSSCTDIDISIELQLEYVNHAYSIKEVHRSLSSSFVFFWKFSGIIFYWQRKRATGFLLVYSTWNIGARCYPMKTFQRKDFSRLNSIYYRRYTLRHLNYFLWDFK